MPAPFRNPPVRISQRRFCQRPLQRRNVGGGFQQVGEQALLRSQLRMHEGRFSGRGRRCGEGFGSRVYRRLGFFNDGPHALEIIGEAGALSLGLQGRPKLLQGDVFQVRAMLQQKTKHPEHRFRHPVIMRVAADTATRRSCRRRGELPVPAFMPS